MDPKNLKYFVAVAQYGSINAAAKAMFISQPQLSHIIKSIEEDVGFELFQRTSSGSSLTRNGEAFMSHCQIILNEMDSLDRFVSQVHHQGSRLTVSMTRFSHTAVCFNDVCARHEEQENLFLRQSVPFTEGAVGVSVPVNVISNEMLKKALDKAVDEEDYEQASQLRDELLRRGGKDVTL